MNWRPATKYIKKTDQFFTLFKFFNLNGKMLKSLIVVVIKLRTSYQSKFSHTKPDGIWLNLKSFKILDKFFLHTPIYYLSFGG